MVFNVGDRVRLEHDHPDSIWVVMMVYEDTGRIGILHSTKDGSQMLWVNPSRLTLIDRYADLKQAIREVLLSKEFLEAFAAAWQKTPILHESELNLIVADETRPYKSWNEIIKEAFQPVTTAEVNSDASLEPITGSESEAYYLNKLKKGESK